MTFLVAQTCWVKIFVKSYHHIDNWFIRYHFNNKNFYIYSSYDYSLILGVIYDTSTFRISKKGEYEKNEEC